MARIIQPVSQNYQYQGGTSKVFAMIDNYIYLYHTDTLIALPVFPESLQDSVNTTFSSTDILSRTAPIYSYSNSGPRSFSVSLPMHRDLMNGVAVESSSLNVPQLTSLTDNAGEDYMDWAIKQIQAAAYPVYGSGEKMVNPPIVAIRFGTDIFCKGVIQGGVAITYSGPILRTEKYAEVTLDFTINEIDPYEAYTAAASGGYRGLNTTLERRIYKSNGLTNNTTNRSSGGGGRGLTVSALR